MQNGWSPVVPLVKHTMLRSSGFGGCWKIKSAHQKHMLSGKSSKVDVSETNLQLAFEGYFSPEPREQRHVFNHVYASKSFNCNYRHVKQLLVPDMSQEQQSESCYTKSVVLNMRYLHILHGHDVHPALGSSLGQLRAEGIHDDNGFEDRSLAFFTNLEECFCFVLIITKHCGDLSCKKQMSVL